jgi:hypothetical protein
MLPFNLIAEGVANVGSLVEFVGGKPTPQLKQSPDQLQHWVSH